VLIALSPLLLAACTQPVNPSFSVTQREANQAISEMRAHPRKLARPLVVIGGFLDFDVSPPLFKAWFRGMVTCMWRWNTRRRRLRDAIRSCSWTWC